MYSFMHRWQGFDGSRLHCRLACCMGRVRVLLKSGCSLRTWNMLHFCHAIAAHGEQASSCWLQLGALSCKATTRRPPPGHLVRSQGCVLSRRQSPHGAAA